MSLVIKIEKAKNLANAMANFTISKHRKFVWNHCFQSDLRRIINDDLMNSNPDSLFEEYKEYFLTKELPTKTIDTKTVFYRGRIGNEVLYGAEDDYNKSFILPYYRSGIEAPPPIYTEGGRFNRQGISYLYLADTIETCLAEVHLQIGQNCSVGEFKCKKEIEIIDLTKFCGNAEMEVWLNILTQPVHSETKHIYNMTRFLADVFKSINSNGLYFESVQAEGNNIVCFNPALFELVEYSERIYAATKIKYNYQQVTDSIREYAMKSKGKSISSHNEDEDEKNNKKFEYLNNWIEYESEKIKREAEEK